METRFVEYQRPTSDGRSTFWLEGEQPHESTCNRCPYYQMAVGSMLAEGCISLSGKPHIVTNSEFGSSADARIIAKTASCVEGIEQVVTYEQYQQVKAQKASQF